MNFKKKIKRVLAISMAFSMIFCSNAFATPIDVVNSTEDVKTDTLDKTQGTDYFADENNEWVNGTINEEVRVKVDLASQFTVTIPKEIVLDGTTGKADYKVKAVGDIAGDQVLNVVPDADFILSEKGGKDDQTAIVTQPDTQYTYRELQVAGTEYDGNISATLSAGEWSGKFNFNIEFKSETAAKTFNDYTWAEIAAISEAGNAASTFAVGDEKELQIGSETYHVQILGFNHDDKSDGSGKAGITVGLKEAMTTDHIMNNRAEGWGESEMRTYINNDIYNNLPSDLQSVIKTVDKFSDNGIYNSDEIITTKDKLFLFSFEEVALTEEITESNDTIVGIYHQGYTLKGQGTKYEYFTGNSSRIKYKNDSPSNWWLRSTCFNATEDYCFNVLNDGSFSVIGDVYIAKSIVFGFCI